MNRPLALFLNVLWVVIIVMLIYGVGPALETKWFPVYSRFKLVEITETETGVLAVFEYTKWRNCDPQGYAWYNGDLGGGVKQLNTERVAPQPQVPRPLGTNISAPVKIDGVTIEDMTKSVFAELYSRCHPLWLTRTEVYP